MHAHLIWNHHTVIDLGCPNSELQKYSDFSHGQHGPSSSQSRPGHVSIQFSHRPAYHPSRRHAQQKRSVNPSTRNCFIRRLLVTQGVWQLDVGLGSTDHCTIWVSQSQLCQWLRWGAPAHPIVIDSVWSIEPQPFLLIVYIKQHVFLIIACKLHVKCSHKMWHAQTLNS